MSADKRPLSQIRGPIRTEGEADALRAAWEAASREEPDTLTHGFHPWPARMHPAIARVILERSGAEALIDPFCGAGTTLIEARVRGARSLGVDLSPLAIRLARVKASVPSRASRAAFLEAAHAVAAASEARVRGRVPMTVALPPPIRARWDMHVLKELGGLREELRALDAPDALREALLLAFSSILTKVGRQRSETEEEIAPRRVRKGLATEIFLRKAVELERRWGELAAAARGPAPELVEGDARRLPELARGRRAPLILTSPPYGGTYDYAAHHAHRMAWLELDDRALRRGELGARRHASAPDARARWDRDVVAMLRAMAAVLEPSGAIVLVMGDASLGGEPVPVPAQLARLAPQAGLAVRGVASQARHGGRDEHLVRLHLAAR
ncbi:MAG: hypothetical protein KF729_14380 [Sandaracinaceae bacterium]|nr:hypothetical protein [Sandaracinaceae bacterium]